MQCFKDVLIFISLLDDEMAQVTTVSDQWNENTVGAIISVSL